jgi:hypothetical protein
MNNKSNDLIESASVLSLSQAEHKAKQLAKIASSIFKKNDARKELSSLLLSLSVPPYFFEFYAL